MINLENVSKKKLLWLSTAHWILYSLFCVILPCITIMTKYGLIGERVTIISGIGISVLMIFLFIGMKLLKQQANKIAIDSYLWKARIKAVLNLMFSIIVPLSVLVLVFLIRDNMELALSAISSCVIYILIGFCEDCILGSSVERENFIRDKSKAEKERDKRRNKV